MTTILIATVLADRLNVMTVGMESGMAQIKAFALIFVTSLVGWLIITRTPPMLAALVGGSSGGSNPFGLGTAFALGGMALGAAAGGAALAGKAAGAQATSAITNALSEASGRAGQGVSSMVAGGEAGGFSKAMGMDGLSKISESLKKAQGVFEKTGQLASRFD